MEYIKTLLLQIVAVLILFNVCIILIPKNIRKVIGKIFTSLFHVAKTITKLSIQHYNSELSKPKSQPIKLKKVVNDNQSNTTSNVIQFPIKK